MSHDDFKSLLEARDEAELRQRAQEFVVELGFDYYLYATGLKIENSTTSFTKVITTYPATWIEKYVSAGFAAIDPAVRYAWSDARRLSGAKRHSSAPGRG